MKLSEELTWRGFVNQTTYPDISVLDGEPISFYIGVDPSSDSMTIGNLASIMMVRHFIECGHRAFMLVGGATGMIGDPDGKASERKLLTLDQITSNKSAIAQQFKGLLAGKEFTLVDNYDWFKDINYLSFLRDVGKYVPMSSMLGRDFVKSRLGEDGSGISYAEFSYSLIQGYDFLHLFRHHDVTLQLCGADQWGNSITGVDLIRKLENKEAHVYSTPLVVNKTTGAKFGKSEDGAVWLDPNKTSVYKFYQFWLNTDDAGVIDYLKFYTLLGQEEINNLAGQVARNPGERAAQKALAHEVTNIVHGREHTEAVERVTDVLFDSADFKLLRDSDLDDLAFEIPTISVGCTVIEALVQSGLCSSNGEARRLIEGGAISVNGDKVSSDFTLEAKSLIKKGKNSFALVR
ncbi:tyrosine--tRNA ligase [Candidatus Saccharibacteria bacterium]|nr:tyrosine--tRNA ligase [Candidatus Saccharibacteria bacterium]